VLAAGGFVALFACLGYHYVTDVVGGFLAGAAWLGSSTVLLLLRQRRPPWAHAAVAIGDGWRPSGEPPCPS
jgi:membrane-associated phospholipid phosphatase